MPKKLSDASKLTRQQKIYNILRHHDSEAEGLQVSDIHERLIKDGTNVSQKTITRDLDEMSTSHNIESSLTKPAKYYCSGEFDPEYQLTFSETELLSMALALNSLKEMSDPFQRSLCEKTEAILKGKLPRQTASRFGNLKSLTIVSPGIRAIAGVENGEAYKAVLSALESNRKIECENHSPYKDMNYRLEKRKFSPLKLNMVGGEQYLFAIEDADDKIKRLKICRLRNIKVLDEKMDPALRERELTNQHAIGGYGDAEMPVTKYVVFCDELMGILFSERMMHPTQKVTKQGDEYVITFECNPSQEISRYLAGWAKHIRSIEPAETMAEMEEIFVAGIELGRPKKEAA